MRTNDRTVIFAVIGVALVVAFYFLLIAPKRSEVGELDSKIADANAAVAEQEQLASLAEGAKEEYRSDYQHLVVLGKAVPGDDDVSSLIEQVNSKADEAGIEFRSLTLAAGDGGAAAAPAPTAPGAEATTTPAEPGATPTDTSAPATEQAVALLPLGATVGPAGLPTMPYDLSFTGDYFEIADFLAGLDSMVKVDDDGVGVNGRLLTVDGFSLTSPGGNFPHLAANRHVTSVVTPADQGLTAGATPAAPAETTTTPASTTPTTAPPMATATP